MGTPVIGTIGIIGAGTMGRGIAQVAITQGFGGILTDVSETALVSAREEIDRRLARLVEKNRMTIDERQAALDRLQTGPEAHSWSRCDLLLEAIIENADVKVEALKAHLGLIPENALIATNTSSISVTAIGRLLNESARTVGLHFFNPAPIQPLIEVIRGDETDADMLAQAVSIGNALGKTVVVAADRPGFIVNRVARPFYLEAWRLLEEGIAGVDDIDDTLRRLAGFRMGPFELMDFVGQDLSLSVTQSVWEGFDRPERFAPRPLQREMVAAGLFGRSAEHGAYNYTTDPPRSAIDLLPQPVFCTKELTEAFSQFAKSAADKPVSSEVESMVLGRILVAIINEAHRALEEGVATIEDIDAAMRLGTSYPMGPFEWTERIGIETCRRLLMLLDQQSADDRFTPVGDLAAP